VEIHILQGKAESAELSVSDRTFREVTEFLYRESNLLDKRRYREWLGLLTDDITYLMVARVRKERESVAATQEQGFMIDNKEKLELRVRRDETDFAWSENPPSFTRHFVTNIIIEPGPGEGEEISVGSGVLLWVHRGDNLNYELFSYERQDILRRVNGTWKLASRKIIPDSSRLSIERISFLL
jgi:3-phenylpropionate/cinnamic acid dioxygenase small subunit